MDFATGRRNRVSVAQLVRRTPDATESRPCLCQRTDFRVSFVTENARSGVPVFLFWFR